MRLRTRTIVSIAALAAFLLAAAFLTTKNILRNRRKPAQLMRETGASSSATEAPKPDPFSGDLTGPDVHLYLASEPVAELLGAPTRVANGDGNDLLGEFEGANVQDIDIRGANRVRESEVLKMIRTRKGRPFAQRDWEQDFHRLDDVGRFLNIRLAEPIKVPGGVRLTIEVIENPLIQALSFNGKDGLEGAIFGDSFVKGQAIHLDRLASATAQFETGAFDKGRMQRAKLEIERFAKENGFTEPAVEYDFQSLSSHQQWMGGKAVPVDDAVAVKFTIALGARSCVRSVSVQGVTAFGEAVVLNEVQTAANHVCSAELLEADRKRIAAFYRKNGYAGVEVGQPQITEAGMGVSKLTGARERCFDVAFTVVEGPQHVVGQVNFVGNLSFTAKELERAPHTRPGALLIVDTVKEDFSRVESYYAERGWPAARVDAIRVRVKDPERLKFAANLWDVTFRVAEGARTVKLPFATQLKGKSEDVMIQREPAVKKIQTPKKETGPAETPRREEDKF